MGYHPSVLYGPSGNQDCNYNQPQIEGGEGGKRHFAQAPGLVGYQIHNYFFKKLQKSKYMGIIFN
jgi:hypothetical protein